MYVKFCKGKHLMLWQTFDPRGPQSFNGAQNLTNKFSAEQSYQVPSTYG
jgi:hypothetical protein